jgi:hypothetical protein
MKHNRWNIKILILLFCCLVAAGCGNDNSDFVFNPSTTPTVNGTVAGKLFLGTPIPDVPITVESFDGTALASTNTDNSGNFVMSGSFPADFRVVARPDSSIAFSREVRGFSSEGVFAAITVQTSLASLLAQAQPGTALADHEAAIRRGLGLGENESLAKLNESVNENFSQLAFFAEAQQNGGVQAYIEQLLASERLERPLRLRRETLSVDLSGLPPALAGPLGRLQNDPDLRTSTLRLTARGLPDSPAGAIFYRRVTPPNAVDERVLGQFGEIIAGIGEVAADVAESLLEDVGDDAVDSIFDAIFGYNDNDDDQGQTYSAAQIAYFVGGDLDDVIQQLTDIQATATQILDSLQAAAQTATQAALQNDFAQANVFVDTIQGYQNNLIVGVNQALSQDSYFNNQPGTLPQSVQTTVAQLQNAQSITELTEAVNSLGALLGGADPVPAAVIGQSYPPVIVNTNSNGTPSAARPNLVLAQRDALFEPLGIVVGSDTQRFANFPVRSSALLDQVLAPWEGYAQSQILGANLIAEAAHLSSDPVSNIELAYAYANNVAINLMETRAQVPDYPLSDDYIIDVQAGLCWYAVVQAPSQDVVTIAETFDDGVHQDWRLPSPKEMQSLLLRAGVAAGEGRYAQNPDLQDIVKGLEALGFDTSQMDTNSSTENFWFSFNYELNGTTWTTPSTDGGLLYSLTGDYRSSLADNVQEYVPNATVPYSFVLCRTVGESPVFDCLQVDVTDTIQILNPGPGTWPSNGFVTDDIQTDELPSLGVCIGFGGGSTDDSSYIIPGASWQINTGSSDYALGDVSYSTDYVHDPSFLERSIIPPTYFETVDKVSGRADQAGIEVSNFASTFGRTLRHANSAAGTVVTFFTLGLDNTGAFPRRLTASNSDYFETPQPQIEPQQIQINPRNVRINVSLVGASQQFVATGFNQDQTVVDLTGQVTWSVTAAGGGAAVGASFSTQTPGLLNLQDVANATQDLVITAELASPSLSDTTNVEALH